MATQCRSSARAGRLAGRGLQDREGRGRGSPGGHGPRCTDDVDATGATSGSRSATPSPTTCSSVDGTGFGTDAAQCFGTPDAPGDCGETIHLVAVTDSIVENNRVVDNVGGILLTDEFGPSSGNIIRGNYSVGNTDDCGITLAGHSAAVNPATGSPTGAAGVFDNLVVDNVSDDNGVAGQGAGILLGGGAAYAGVYGNVDSRQRGAR